MSKAVILVIDGQKKKFSRQELANIVKEHIKYKKEHDDLQRAIEDERNWQRRYCDEPSSVRFYNASDLPILVDEW